MKAIVKSNTGIEFQKTCSIPHPDNHSVLIRVSLAGLCRTELYVAQNKIPVREGIILGHEFTGEVVEVGGDVTHALLNRRVGVMPFFLQDNQPTMLGVDCNGAYAEYVVVPASTVYPLPDHLSMEEAVFLEPITACLAVLNEPISPDQKVLIYGTNRIAELTYRILHNKGFSLIDMGAENQLSNRANEYDYVIETESTEAAFETIVRLVKPKGKILLKSRPSGSIPLPLKAIVKKEINLSGVHYGSFSESIQLLASGALKIDDLFGSTYSLEEAIPILLEEQKETEDKKIFFKP